MLERRSGPSEVLALHLFSPQQNGLLLDQIASADFQTDWGSRGVGAGSASFDPESYSKGSVSPLGTAELAKTFWSEHRPVTALALWNTMLPLSALDSLGHMHEVLAGNFYRPQIESVPEQTWSSAGFLDATIHGLLGLQVDAIANRLTFAPRIPISWSAVSVTHIQLAAAPVSLTLHRDADSMTLEIDNPGQPFNFEFAPDLPLGAKVRGAALNHQPIEAKVETHPQQTNAKVVLTVPHGKSELRLDLQGGVSVIPEAPEPLLGDASAGVRIVDVHLEGDLLTVDADVPTGRASHLLLKTAWGIGNVEGATAQPVADGLFKLSFGVTHEGSAPYRRVHAIIEFKQ
jgi:hypothetical protein